MDPYSELQQKLIDITQRFAHETRYVQECAPMPAGAGEMMMDSAHKPPYEETRESLEKRAQLTAHAIVALNVQVEQLLGSLPADDVGEEEQMRTLQQVILENQEAGAGVRREKELVRQVLAKVRSAMVNVSHRSHELSPHTECSLWPPLPLPAPAVASAASVSPSAPPVAVKQEP